MALVRARTCRPRRWSSSALRAMFLARWASYSLSMIAPGHIALARGRGTFDRQTRYVRDSGR